MNGSTAWKWGAAALAVAFLVPLTLVMVGGVAVVALPTYQCTVVLPSPSANPAESAADVSWNPAQVGHVATIVRVGAEKNVPSKGWTVAVATAMQESTLRNLANSTVPESLNIPNEGVGRDHDSVGLFQQRPGWGTVAQRMTPDYAAGKFYDALVKVNGWEHMSLAEAAQAVQVSRYPDAYAKWQSEAQRLAQLVRGQLGISCSGGATGEWRVPLPEGSYSVGDGWGAPRGNRAHSGIDLIAPTGTPVLAAAAGTVTSAECTSAYCDRPGNPDLPGCGLTVEIQHAGGMGTTYCHLVSLSVAPGQAVDVGQEIGRVGSTGHSSGPHLHYQIHRNAPPINNQTAQDPAAVMADLGIRF
ncbi:M23 family metallopeptidase [Micromonospora sp. KLBMP9576]|uniref:M23 family metallopeptidase n=1 Tax=Micromonospora sp. KLBMP9576 TaxID=3424769 RepID=UPI003D89B1D3